MRVMFVILFIGCISVSNEKSLEQSIIKKIESSNLKTFKLSEITSFDWDSLYIFTEHTDSDFISSRLRFSYKGQKVPDSKWRMVFTKRNTVAYEEDFGGVPYKKSNLFIFMPIDESSYSPASGKYTGELDAISNRDAIFRVTPTREKDNSFFYYYLIPEKNVGKALLKPA